MTSIWLPETARLKGYKANVNGARAAVDIKIEVGDHTDLGFLLHALADIQERQKRAAAKKAAPAPSRPALKALSAPLLQIADFSGGDHE